MRLLLDTHVLLWLALKPDLLPPALDAELWASRHELLVSAASIWEISIKFHIGKLPEAAAIIQDVPGTVSALGAALLDISAAHALRAGALDWAHRDPFDRMLVAQAVEDGLRLVTLDERVTSFRGAPVYPAP